MLWNSSINWRVYPKWKQRNACLGGISYIIPQAYLKQKMYSVNGYVTAKRVYCKVASSRLSWLVAHFGIFRLLMKEKFDAYELWYLAKIVQSWIVYCLQLYSNLDNQVALPWRNIRGCYYFLCFCCWYRFSSLKFSSLMFDWCGCYEIKSNI